jgi:hypothetical protein
MNSNATAVKNQCGERLNPKLQIRADDVQIVVETEHKDYGARSENTEENGRREMQAQARRFWQQARQSDDHHERRENRDPANSGDGRFVNVPLQLRGYDPPPFYCVVPDPAREY